MPTPLRVLAHREYYTNIMQQETFNEKCDRILRYLLAQPNRFEQITTWQKFTTDTSINSSDSALSFLLKDKKYIGSTSHDVWITPLGEQFISNSTFHQEQRESEIESSLNWYNREDAKQRFEAYPSLKKREQLLTIIAVVELLVIVIIGVLQLKK